MIYAEKQKFDNGDGSGYSLFYLVYNGDTIGSYRTDYNRYGEVGKHASRDYHRIATQNEIEAHNNWRAYQAESDEVQERMDEDGTAPSYAYHVDHCGFHDDKLCVCDGSYLVEVTTDDKR